MTPSMRAAPCTRPMTCRPEQIVATLALGSFSQCLNDELRQHHCPILIRLQRADDDFGAHLHGVAVQFDASAQEVDIPDPQGNRLAPTQSSHPEKKHQGPVAPGLCGELIQLVRGQIHVAPWGSLRQLHAPRPPGKLFYQPDGSPQLDEYADFIGGHIDPDPTKHATVMFLDIVGSTKFAEAMGDASWTQTLDDLDGFVRREVDQRAGRVVKFTGDGHLAVFDRAEDALFSALRISHGVHALGVEVRTGLHTGEVTLRSAGDIGGLAVHIGARVMAKADARQVFVSEETAERAREAGLTFADRGVHVLKGVSGEHRILEIVTSQPATAAAAENARSSRSTSRPLGVERR